MKPFRLALAALACAASLAFAGCCSDGQTVPAHLAAYQPVAASPCAAAASPCSAAVAAPVQFAAQPVQFVAQPVQFAAAPVQFATASPCGTQFATAASPCGTQFATAAAPGNFAIEYKTTAHDVATGFVAVPPALVKCGADFLTCVWNNVLNPWINPPQSARLVQYQPVQYIQVAQPTAAPNPCAPPPAAAGPCGK